MRRRLAVLAISVTAFLIWGVAAWNHPQQTAHIPDAGQLRVAVPYLVNSPLGDARQDLIGRGIPADQVTVRDQHGFVVAVDGPPVAGILPREWLVTGVIPREATEFERAVDAHVVLTVERPPSGYEDGY